MNLTLKVSASLLAAVTCFSAFSETRVNSEQIKKNNKVDVKCYVELVGGGETISFWSIKPSQLDSLKSSIIGDDILVLRTQKRANIYRAKECVLAEDDFKNPIAKAMDKELPR